MIQWTTTRSVLWTLALALLTGSAWAQEAPPARGQADPVAPPAQPAPETPAPAPTDSATETPGPNGEPVAPAERPGWESYLPMVGLMALLFVLYFVMGRKPKKEEQRRKEMIENLKKGDKVTSIGGIMGTVLDVRGDEIVVKVDETNNTRMAFAKWAIRTVGTEEAEKAK